MLSFLSIPFGFCLASPTSATGTVSPWRPLHRFLQGQDDISSTNFLPLPLFILRVCLLVRLPLHSQQHLCSHPWLFGLNDYIYPKTQRYVARRFLPKPAIFHLSDYGPSQLGSVPRSASWLSLLLSLIFSNSTSCCGLLSLFPHGTSLFPDSCLVLFDITQNLAAPAIMCLLCQEWAICSYPISNPLQHLPSHLMAKNFQ